MVAYRYGNENSRYCCSYSPPVESPSVLAPTHASQFESALVQLNHCPSPYDGDTSLPHPDLRQYPSLQKMTGHVHYLSYEDPPWIRFLTGVRGLPFQSSLAHSHLRPQYHPYHPPFHLRGCLLLPIVVGAVAGRVACYVWIVILNSAVDSSSYP